MSDRPARHGVLTNTRKPGPGAHARRRRDTTDTCDTCGAHVAGTGPLLAAFYEAPGGALQCCAECCTDACVCEGAES